MSIQLKVDSWDYREAIKKVENLLKDITCKCGDTSLQNLPSATEIVDTIIDTII